jgi:hypothetical protein
MDLPHCKRCATSTPSLGEFYVHHHEVWNGATSLCHCRRLICRNADNLVASVTQNRGHQLGYQRFILNDQNPCHLGAPRKIGFRAGFLSLPILDES